MKDKKTGSDAADAPAKVLHNTIDGRKLQREIIFSMNNEL